MNLYISYFDDFKNIIKSENGNVFLDEPMKNHTSFKVGGAVDIMVIPGNYEELQKSIKICIKESIPYLIIGNGSNLLVKDKGIRGVVIKLTAINEVKVEDARIIAGSGALLSDVSEIALEHSLAGFEFACGIPGCVGGAVAMNAGAYGGQIDSVIENALIIDKKGEFQRLNKEQLELGYRSSAILKYDYSVVEASFKLERGEYGQIKEAIDDLQGKRRDKQPLEFPSAGSTFKRPEGYFAGKLIEDSGLKGVQLGGAQVSQKHSGFIINTGNATAGDVLALIAHVQKTVFDKFGVELHTEVRIIGED
jgi:UDP-N-acetylmuramate dehydrogenase